jgi:3',5'-cyclic-AMP phosphodiesterase
VIKTQFHGKQKREVQVLTGELFSMSVRLVLVTDIHLGPNTGNVYGDRALEFFDEFSKAAAEARPELVVDLGDRLTEINRETDMENLINLAQRFRSLPCARKHLIGNHDLLPKALQETILETNLSSHAIDFAGWQLVFLESFDGTIGGAISNETVTWLETVLQASSAPAVIFSHQPLHGLPMTGNPYFESDYAEHACAKNSAKVREVLERANTDHPGKVRLCLNGHAHWMDSCTIGSIPFVTIPSLSESIMTDGIPARAWATLDLNPDTIRLDVHGVKPVTLEFSASKPHRTLAGTARGR